MTPMAERAMARRSEERPVRRRSRLWPLLLLVLLCVLLIAGIGVLLRSGIIKPPAVDSLGEPAEQRYAAPDVCLPRRTRPTTGYCCILPSA